MITFPMGAATIGGPGCFIIAEAGVNHNGDVDLAHTLVDIAARAGADAVKFQTFVPELLTSAGAAKAAYQTRTTGGGTQLDMLKALTLPDAAFTDLRDHANDAGLVFLSTPFDRPSADLLMRLGVSAFKVPSGELTNHPFIAELAGLGPPLLVSTGMATLDEVNAAVSVIRRVDESLPFALLHCVSAYPAPPEDSNLAAMATLAESFGVPVGWSDHTTGIFVAIAAAARGAAIIEKHFTSDTSLPGPDHAASLDPKQLQEMVAGIRDAARAIGSSVKQPVPSETDVARVARRGLYAARDLPAGSRLSAEDVVALRPAGDFSPADLAALIGAELAMPLAAGEPLSHVHVRVRSA